MSGNHVPGDALFLRVMKLNDELGFGTMFELMGGAVVVAIIAMLHQLF